MLNNFFQAIIMGIIQGITEFLPISSTAHLVIYHQFSNSPIINNLTFDVVLHAGTLIALIIYFFQEIIELIKGFFLSIFKPNWRSDLRQRLSGFIIFASLPILIIGYFFGDFLENNLRNILVIIVSLIGVGMLFIIVEKKVKTLRNLETINLGDSFFIGLAQVLALIPGVSRSGITIVAGMSKKLMRRASAKFTFLLAIPAIFGAAVKQFLKINFNNLTNDLILIYLVGFLTAFLAGFFSLKFFFNFLKNHTLIGFAVYRFILAIILIFIFIL